MLKTKDKYINTCCNYTKLKIYFICLLYGARGAFFYAVLRFNANANIIKKGSYCRFVTQIFVYFLYCVVLCALALVACFCYIIALDMGF
jgi:hypothetical protein